MALGHSIPEYVVEPLPVGIIEGGARNAQVVVFGVLPLVVTMMGVIAYVEVLPAPTERVGKEHTAPLAETIRDDPICWTEIRTRSEASS